MDQEEEKKRVLEPARKGIFPYKGNVFKTKQEEEQEEKQEEKQKESTE